MNVTGKTRIFRYDGDGYTSYSRGISSKKYVNGEKTDEWVTIYENVVFPKGTDLPNKCTIDVKDGFEAVSEYKGEKRRKLVVLKFDMVDGGEHVKSEDFEEINEDVPF